jgi:hypothetical protein
MSDERRAELARAAATGDLVAARRLVSLLERERPTKWMVLPSVVKKWELRDESDLRAVVLRIHDRDLLPSAIEAWRLDDPEALEAEIRPSLHLDESLRDAKILAVWAEVARRATCVLLSHPSFAVVRDGDEPPEWIPLPDACRSCGSRLVFSARMRGDELCGPCSRIAQLSRERRQADEIAAQVKAETGVDVEVFRHRPTVTFSRGLEGITQELREEFLGSGLSPESWIQNRLPWIDPPRDPTAPAIQLEVEELTPERVEAIFPPRDPPPAA